jgi:hypothetical protein
MNGSPIQCFPPNQYSSSHTSFTRINCITDYGNGTTASGVPVAEYGSTHRPLKVVLIATLDRGIGSERILSADTKRSAKADTVPTILQCPEPINPDTSVESGNNDQRHLKIFHDGTIKADCTRATVTLTCYLLPVANDIDCCNSKRSGG